MGNKNEIIEEQRRAREEFLKLKKMQNGEINVNQNHKEAVILPKTKKEKAANFWFQYKFHIIISIIVASILSVLVVQCSSKIQYDLEIVYFTYDYIDDLNTNAIADYFKEYVNDINGDGEINVRVLNCGYVKSADSKYKSAVISKLQTAIFANEKALLYITDSESMEYFENSNLQESIFYEEPLLLGDEFYNKVKDVLSEEYYKIPEGLQISCRAMSKTLTKKDAQEYFEESKRIINELKNIYQ